MPASVPTRRGHICRLARGERELVLLEAFERGHGIDTALLAATVERARAMNSPRLWLVIGSSNLDALRFCQRRGMRLVRAGPTP